MSRSFLEKLAYGQRQLDVAAVNETLAEMNAEPVVDRGRHIRTDVGPDLARHKRGCTLK